MKHSIDDAKAAERQVMTIINVTEDSFYDGSRTFTSGEIERRAAAAAEQGADIFDALSAALRPCAASRAIYPFRWIRSAARWHGVLLRRSAG